MVLYSIFKQKGLKLVIAKVFSIITDDRLWYSKPRKDVLLWEFYRCLASLECKAMTSTDFET